MMKKEPLQNVYSFTFWGSSLIKIITIMSYMRLGGYKGLLILPVFPITMLNFLSLLQCYLYSLLHRIFSVSLNPKIGSKMSDWPDAYILLCALREVPSKV